MNLDRALSHYATYHRDRRNLATHCVGIPMIVFAVIVLLSRPAMGLSAVTVSPALIGVVLASIYYLRLDLRFGAVMTALLVIGLAAATPIAAQATGVWLSVGVGLFVLGWILQFVGHYFEGRKPAFVDDLSGLVVGPIFVVAEIAFMLRLRREVQSAVEAQAGPLH